MQSRTGPRWEWPLASALVVSFGGLLMTTFDGWRKGVVVVALGILLAGGLRLLLSDDRAGLLRVRKRLFDTVLLTGLGLGVLALALAVPNLQR